MLSKNEIANEISEHLQFIKSMKFNVILANVKRW